MLLSTCVNTTNPVILGPYERNHEYLPENFDLTDRSAIYTYDFILVFHSNYSPMSNYFRDKWRYICNLLVKMTAVRQCGFLKFAIYVM